MLKVENTSIAGWKPAIRGMRNPMNSWDKSDSKFERDFDCGCSGDCPCPDFEVNSCFDCFVGQKDYELMNKLIDAGTDHRKFMRMLIVYADITAPLYWWKEFDTYKVGTVANSCSTMHKIAAKEFVLDDFSFEHLFKGCDKCEKQDNDMEYYENSTTCLEYVVNVLNYNRQKYLETKNKKYWWQMIQLLPSSYNQRRTVMLNYEVLSNIYRSRKSHKLNEWHTLCDWIETLPESNLITRKDGEQK